MIINVRKTEEKQLAEEQKLKKTWFQKGKNQKFFPRKRHFKIFEAIIKKQQKTRAIEGRLKPALRIKSLKKKMENSVAIRRVELLYNSHTSESHFWLSNRRSTFTYLLLCNSSLKTLACHFIFIQICSKPKCSRAF